MHHPLAEFNQNPTRLKTMHFSEACLKRWIPEVEKVFGLKPKDLTKRRASGKPTRKIGEINLSELRRAIVHVVYESGYIGVKEFGAVLGIDHSSITNLRQTGNEYAEQQDHTFVNYCRAVRTAPLLGFDGIPTVA